MCMTDGKIRCVNEGPCGSSCIGTLVEGQGSVPGVGGGILVQVSSYKTRLVHNFNTGN
jgi:hypothetical protein